MPGIRAVLNAIPLISPKTRRLFHAGHAFFRSMGTRAITQGGRDRVASSVARKLFERLDLKWRSPAKEFFSICRVDNRAHLRLLLSQYPTNSGIQAQPPLCVFCIEDLPSRLFLTPLRSSPRSGEDVRIHRS